MRPSAFKHALLASAALAAATTAASGERSKRLADPARMLATAERMDFVGRNEFASVQSERGPVLRSTPRNSASGLYQRVDAGPGSLTKVTWAWRVDRLQGSADIRTLDKEDVGAAIFFVFGEPSASNTDVPTLAYAWSATGVSNGTLLSSRRLKSLRYIQLRGRGDVGAWRSERRNVAKDYRMAFGSEPGTLVYVAIFNDNDQTREPASALFGAIAGSR